MSAHRSSASSPGRGPSCRRQVGESTGRPLERDAAQLLGRTLRPSGPIWGKVAPATVHDLRRRRHGVGQRRRHRLPGAATSGRYDGPTGGAEPGTTTVVPATTGDEGHPAERSAEGLSEGMDAPAAGEWPAVRAAAGPQLLIPVVHVEGPDRRRCSVVTPGRTLDDAGTPDRWGAQDRRRFSEKSLACRSVLTLARYGRRRTDPGGL